MKAVVMAVSIALLSTPVLAKKDCEALKSEIAVKIESKGVSGYSLEIVDKGKGGDARIVGSCEGGAKEIAYRRDAADKASTAAPAPAAASAPQ